MDENTMYTENNNVKISEEVVQSIAAVAVSEVKGVSLPSSFADGIVEKFVKKNYNKNIRVEIQEKEVTVEVHILVDYGMKIQPVAEELQELVKKNIETMTDLVVTQVNVCVDGIHFVKETKKTEAVEETE